LTRLSIQYAGDVTRWRNRVRDRRFAHLKLTGQGRENGTRGPT
jgi:hypothetical protein